MQVTINKSQHSYKKTNLFCLNKVLFGTKNGAQSDAGCQLTTLLNVAFFIFIFAISGFSADGTWPRKLIWAVIRRVHIANFYFNPPN